MSSCPKDDETRGDLRMAVTMLAGDNARLCEIGLAADALAAEVARLLEDEDRVGAYIGRRLKIVRRALEAYRITRQGQ